MISTVLCGRFYKIFVSPMLHEKSSASAGLFSCSKLFSPPALRAAPEGATGGDPQTPALSVFPLLSVHALAGAFPTQNSRSRSMCL